MQILNVPNSLSSLEDIRDFFKSETSLEEEITFRNIVFPTKEDALKYLEDINQVYNIVYIKYLEPLEDFEDSEVYRNLVDKLNESISNFLNFPELMLKKISEQKSNSKSCSVCKTSVHRDFYVKKTEKRLDNIIETATKQDLPIEDFFDFKMKAIACPICDNPDFIVSETDENKLKSLKNKLSEFEKKLKEEEMAFKIKSGQKTVSVIGYNL